MLLQDIHIETLLPILEKVTPHNKPIWGSMNSQRMIEHLTDVFNISLGLKTPPLLEMEESRREKMREWLESDQEMQQGLVVAHANKKTENRFEEIELAVDELIEAILDYEEFFALDNLKKMQHPIFGDLNLHQWNRMHLKHISHHFNQFGLMELSSN